MVNERTPESYQSKDVREDLRFAGVFSRYLEELKQNGFIDPDEIVAAHPDLGPAVVEDLETYIQLRSVEECGEDQPLGTLGDYTLRRQIGRGGMGVVYDAWENSMDRRVALKVLPAGVAADTRASARFLREAQAAGKLSHPNVVPVYFTGVKEQTPFYAMEFVEGETLAQILVRLRAAEGKEEERHSIVQGISNLFSKRVPQTGAAEEHAPEEAEIASAAAIHKKPFVVDDSNQAYYFLLANAFAGVAEGLQHAHSRKIIHRDIKPSNLILDADGKLRILDFGLARLEGQESLTVSGDFVGTPLYMSPEQARGRKIPIDHRTDIYSLGATMYEMLTWRPPFKGKDHQDTLSQIIGRDPVGLRKRNSRIPKDLETIVLKCLRKDPGDRYRTAEALAQDLRRFVKGYPVEASPQTAFKKLMRRCRHQRWRMAAAVCTMFLLLIIVVLLRVNHLNTTKANLARYEKQMISAALRLHYGRLLANRSSGNMDLISGEMTNNFKYLIPPNATQSHRTSLDALVDVLVDATKLAPDRPEADYYLGKALALTSTAPDDARAAWERALDKDPDFIPAAFFMESFLQNQATNQVLDRKPEEYPQGSWQFLWLQAYSCFQRSEWVTAARAFWELSWQYRRYGEPYFGAAVESHVCRGKALLEAKQYADAIEALVIARDYWPEALEPSLLLGKAYFLSGQKEQAETTFKRLHNTVPARLGGEAALLISAVYFGLDGTKSLEWAREHVPESAVQKALISVNLSRLGEHEAAQAEAERAIKLDSSLSWAHLCRAEALNRQKCYKDAEIVYLQALEADPENCALLEALGANLALQKKWDEALSRLDKARALSPTFSRIHMRLGWVHARSGQFRHAEEVLLGAMHLAASNYERAWFRAWLGHVCHKLGNREKALEWFKEALEEDPNCYDAHILKARFHAEHNELCEAIACYCTVIERRAGGFPIHAYGDLIALLEEQSIAGCEEDIDRLMEVTDRHVNAEWDHSLVPVPMRVFCLAYVHRQSDEYRSRAVEIAREGLSRIDDTDPSIAATFRKIFSLEAGKE